MNIEKVIKKILNNEFVKYREKKIATNDIMFSVTCKSFLFGGIIKEIEKKSRSINIGLLSTNNTLILTFLKSEENE